MHTVESAHDTIRATLLGWAPAQWAAIHFSAPVYQAGCGGMHFSYLTVEGGEERLPFDWDGIDALNRAALFVRNHILATTGKCIWGLTFTLYPDGKFNIDYDYDMPADFEEDEDDVKETLPVTAALEGLRGTGVQLELNDPANQSAEDKLLSSALAWLQQQTSTHSVTWGLGNEVSWNLDMNGGWLHWRFADGRALQAEVQVIGTYNTQNGTFLWGWDHPSVPEPLRRAAQKARTLGTQHGFERLTTRSVACTQDEAWQFTALAAQLDDAVGAYRGDASGTWVYMSFAAPKVVGA